MTKKQAIQLFNDRKIRAAWDDIEEKWYFSIVNVIEVLNETDYQSARKYWKVLKGRLIKEGNQTVTKCYQLKMLAPDGKMRLTDVADQEQLFRLIQSIPSPKAEPFKIWMAKVASERLDEMQDPEQAIDRAMLYYKNLGYSDAWINQRMKSIEVRKELTDEWKARGIDDSRDYAILTNEMTRAWSGMTVQEYKAHKGLKKENLRDNMTNIELVLNMLAEVTTTAISRQEQPGTFDESKAVARRGGKVAKNARKDIETQLGQTVISPLNASDKPALEVKTKENKE